MFLNGKLNKYDDYRATIQEFNCRIFTAEARIRARIGPCGICGGQSDIGTGISQSPSVFPFNIIPPLIHIYSGIVWGVHSVPQRRTPAQ
jgi:hypothetical protein